MTTKKSTTKQPSTKITNAKATKTAKAVLSGNIRNLGHQKR